MFFLPQQLIQYLFLLFFHLTFRLLFTFFDSVPHIHALGEQKNNHHKIIPRSVKNNEHCHKNRCHRCNFDWRYSPSAFLFVFSALFLHARFLFADFTVNFLDFLLQFMNIAPEVRCLLLDCITPLLFFLQGLSNLTLDFFFLFI